MSSPLDTKLMTLETRAYEDLSSYKCYSKSDMLDLARVRLNEYGLSDRDYGKILAMVVGGRQDIYCSDLLSLVDELAIRALRNPYAFDMHYAEYEERRQRRFKIRRSMEGLFNYLTRALVERK